MVDEKADRVESKAYEFARTPIGRAMASLIFGVVSVDFTILGGFTALLLLVALGAGYLPARRAISVDPMVSLRYE